MIRNGHDAAGPSRRPDRGQVRIGAIQRTLISAIFPQQLEDSLGSFLSCITQQVVTGSGAACSEEATWSCLPSIAMNSGVVPGHLILRDLELLYAPHGRWGVLVGIIATMNSVRVGVLINGRGVAGIVGG